MADTRLNGVIAALEKNQHAFTAFCPVAIYEPAGIRGDGPHNAVRYWGISQQEYYQRADVWPLDPNGEIICIIQIEDTVGIENLDDMLDNVPGIGAVLIGEGDGGTK